MKRLDYFLGKVAFVRVMTIAFLLSACALFFLGGDFYYNLSSKSFNSEKKYQDEENSDQSEKTEKDQDGFFSIANEPFKNINFFIIDCSNIYFIISETKRLKGYSDILSPPPDAFGRVVLHLI